MLWGNPAAKEGQEMVEVKTIRLSSDEILEAVAGYLGNRYNMAIPRTREKIKFRVSNLGNDSFIDTEEQALIFEFTWPEKY